MVARQRRVRPSSAWHSPGRAGVHAPPFTAERLFKGHCMACSQALGGALPSRIAARKLRGAVGGQKREGQPGIPLSSLDPRRLRKTRGAALAHARAPTDAVRTIAG